MIMDNNYPNSSIPGAAFEPPDSSLSMYSHDSEFMAPDFFVFNEQWIVENPAFSSFPADYTSQSSNHSASEVVYNSNGSNNHTFYEEPCNIHGGVFVLSGDCDKEKKEVKGKVAFKTKSEVEILDDGFKWRKYGKKMVKNSPNPRNYYRCSVEGCPVKKRVERDKEDSRYVVTTYEGIHNHQGPQP